MVGNDNFLSWNTGPSNLGSAQCTWCGRTIYRPAVPCSVTPPAGLLQMETKPGHGERCKWELTTRQGVAS
jgi:hypothetical protein